MGNPAENPQETFSHLNVDIFLAHPHRWFVRYETMPIKRIALHNCSSSRKGMKTKSAQASYTVVFYLDAEPFETVMEDTLDHYELSSIGDLCAWEVSAIWDTEPIVLAMAASPINSPYGLRLAELMDGDFKDVYKQKPEGEHYRHEWTFRCLHRGEVLQKGILKKRSLVINRPKPRVDIPPDIQNLAPKSEVRHPTREEVEYVRGQIRRDGSFLRELLVAEVDLDELAHLVALNLYLDHVLNSCKEERKDAKDDRRDVLKRIKEVEKRAEKYPHKKSRSSLRIRLGRLKALMRVIASEGFAKQEIGIGTKKPFYYDRFLLDMKRLFGKAKHPFTLMAAVVNRFGLHPEHVCKGCEYFDTTRKECKIGSVLLCHRHKQARDSIYHYLKTIKVEPSYTYSVFKPSESK